jgi:phosphatidyl-myo-inositol dimannoside synthase
VTRWPALLLLPDAYSSDGGIQAYGRTLCRAFFEIAAERSAAAEAFVLADPRGRRVVASAAGSGSVTGFGGSRARFALGAVAWAHSRRPPMVVLGHLNLAPVGLLLASMRPTCRLWVIAYGVEAWTRRSAMTRHVLRRAERVLAISDYTRAELTRRNGLPPASVDLLPCALDPAWSARVAQSGELAPGGRPVILSVCRLAADEGYKGVDLVIQSLPSVLRSVPDLEYWIVGEGDDRPRLEALARGLSVADRVRFKGRLPLDELAAAYAAATVFALPSLGEGFGIVFLEAGAFGKPSVALRAAAVPEVVLDRVTGRLAAGRDPAELAGLLAEVLSQPGTRARLGAAARERVASEYSYARFRQRLTGLLESGEGAA